MSKQQSKRKPQRRKPKPAVSQLLPGETGDILKDLRQFHNGDLERWLDTPHDWFYGRKPRELLGTDREGELRHWLGMVKLGMFT